jgi:hypothetical protein
MIETVQELISTYCRMMEEELDISRKTIHSLLVEILRKWKICTLFVLRCLSDEENTLSLSAFKSLFSVCMKIIPCVTQL